MRYSSQVTSHVFLGSEKACYETTWSRILTVKEYLPHFVKVPEAHAHVPLRDTLDARIDVWLPHIVDFIKQSVAQDKIVLVHCQMGVSRSAACVVAYLMEEESLTYPEALARVTAVRPQACPNQAFEQQLREYTRPTPDDCEVELSWLIAQASFAKRAAGKCRFRPNPEISKAELAECFILWGASDVCSCELREVMTGVLSELVQRDEKQKQHVLNILNELMTDDDLIIDMPLLVNHCNRLAQRLAT